MLFRSSKFFHEFLEAGFDGVAWNRYHTATMSGRGLPIDTKEYRVKRFISIDPTVGSRSNFFHEFPEAGFDGLVWNRYHTATMSGRGLPIDTNRVPGQKVRIYRSDRWIALKFFHEFSEAVFDGVAWNRYDTTTTFDCGVATETTR